MSTTPPEVPEVIGAPQSAEPVEGPRQGRITDAHTRAIVTVLLVIIFGVTNITALGFAFWDQAHCMSWQGVREVAEILLPTQGALIGSAIGFYFADHRR